MKLSTPIYVLLKSFDLGLVLLFLPLRLGLCVGNLFLHLNVLKDEQHEQPAAFVVCLLQNK